MVHTRWHSYTSSVLVTKPDAVLGCCRSGPNSVTTEATIVTSLALTVSDAQSATASCQEHLQKFVVLARVLQGSGFRSSVSLKFSLLVPYRVVS